MKGFVGGGGGLRRIDFGNKSQIRLGVQGNEQGFENGGRVFFVGR